MDINELQTQADVYEYLREQSQEEDDAAWEEEQERIVEDCHCGAWKLSKGGEAILIADCVC